MKTKSQIPEDVLNKIIKVNAARIKAEKKMNKLKKIEIEVKQIKPE